MTLYFANLSNRHLLPTLSNFTVAFSFSPTPSTLITLPMPKRWCSMVAPTARLCFSVAAEDREAAGDCEEEAETRRKPDEGD